MQVKIGIERTYIVLVAQGVLQAGIYFANPGAILVFGGHVPAPFYRIRSQAALLAQTAAPAPNPLFSMLPLFLLVGGMYFLMIAPQRRKQKALEKMLTALQTGDEVITTGGLYGVITNVKDDRYVIRIGDATKIEVAKGFIQSVVKKDGVEEPKS